MILEIDNMPFFSIIIPAYNAERFLPQTLDSVVNQLYEDFEVLIINDGSNDCTLSIAETYANKDERVIVIDKKNEGVSVARNAGLELAKGEYVLFVDADDTMTVEALAVLREALQKRPVDIIRYEHQTIDDHGDDLYPNYHMKTRRKYHHAVLSNAQFIQRILLDECFLWVHAFRRSLIEKYQIRFLPNCTYNEDTLFIVQYLQHCQECSYIPLVLYKYRKFSDAVTASFTQKNFIDVLNVFEHLKELTEREQNTPFSQSLRLIMERLGLQLFRYSVMWNTKKEIDTVTNYCLSSPYTVEWKMLSLLGDNWGRKILPLVEIYRKIERRFL